MSDEETLPDDDGEIRASLGLESPYGYHILRPLDDDEGVGSPAPPEDVQGGGVTHASPVYPCLRGVRYSGCVGMACPLTTCWSGAPTPAAAAYRVRTTRPGTVVYLGHILCHHCVHVVRALPGAGGGQAPATARRARFVTCARAKWRCAASLHSFATCHVPLQDDIEPLDCPEFENSGTLHPAVVAYRARHRQAMRLYRARRHGDAQGTEGGSHP